MGSHAEFALNAIRWSPPKSKRKDSKRSHSSKNKIDEKDPSLMICGIPTTVPSLVKHVELEKDQQVDKSKNEELETSKTESIESESIEASIDDCQDEIQEIDISAKELLNQAILSRQPNLYYKALTIDDERKQLQKRADQLKHRLQIELRVKSRKLASKYYGWIDVPWEISSTQELDGLWRNLRVSTAHEYPLEDPLVSRDFFTHLRQSMIQNDLTELGEWSPIYKNEIQNWFQDYSEVFCIKKFIYN